jgi:hypothetical protein
VSDVDRYVITGKLLDSALSTLPVGNSDIGTHNDLSSVAYTRYDVPWFVA